MTTFKLIQKIGEGSYSRVYKAISEESQRTLAVKIISFKDAPLDYVSSRQLKILKEIKHPNIATLLDCIVSQSSVYLVFQYYSMNLNQFYRYYQSQYGRALDQPQVRFIMLQVSSALAYLHSLHVMHRDIKPENIMVDPATLNIKLIDFGFAKKIIDDPDTGYMVTRWYRPLEVVINLKYDEKIDVFSTAAIYLELIQGKEIFQSESNMVQLNKLLTICGYPSQGSRQFKALQKLGIQNNFNPPIISEYCIKLPEPIRGIVASMMSNCPHERPSIDSLLQGLMNWQPVQTFQRLPPMISQGGRRRAKSTTAGLTLAKHFSKEKGLPIKSTGGVITMI